METIAHFSHQHLLTTCEIGEHKEVDCAACEKHCSNQSYCCKECKFFLHKSCAELSRELKHYLHPDNLTLCDTAKLGCRYCDSCGKRFRGFTYRCQMCNFDLDIECARKSTNGSKVKKQIQHFSHGDPLILEEVIDEDKERWCRACERRCLTNTYYCGSCQFFIHKPCAELQQELHHPAHLHTLKLCPTVDDDAGLSCDFCGEIFHGFVYQCNECQFHLDVICAQQLPSSETRGQKQTDHFGHRHPLTLRLRDDEDDIFKCRACDERCLGPVYGCEQCKYFLHESCAELPLERGHFYHEQHPLKLQVAKYHNCALCGNRIEGYTYRCEQCDFDLDVLCAQMTSMRPGEGRVTRPRKKVEDIKKQHFCHEHVLTGSEKSEEDRVFCSGCKKQCSGLTYACDTCKFYLHEACSELPREYEHFFHPLHKLTLQNSHSGVYCRACEKKCRGFTFSCKECNFHLDVVCAMKVEKVTRDPACYIPHFSHGHPLKITDEEWNTTCLACSKQRLDSGLIYGCKKCRVWLHKSCAELPQKINHFFHKECTGQLNLEVRSTLEPRLRKVKCRACHKECQGFIFRCELCRFKLDVECALMPSIIPEGTQTKCSSGHGHPLQLRQINGDATVRWCSVCENRCVDATYECSQCEFFVHESCTELTPVIFQPSHPFHPKHKLELRIKDRFTCEACLKESSGFTYDCRSCPFSLHVGCANLKPKIQFDAHDHYLCFFDSLYAKVRCNACKREIIPCSSKKNKGEMESKAEVVRCVRCNYNRHLVCGPLPCAIKSEDHKHDIQLEDELREDESGVYYCDACERKRNPEESVYRCTRAQCPYVAHFHCMKSEVTCLLKGVQKEIELRTLGTRISGKLMSEDQEITASEPHSRIDFGREMGTEDFPTLENLLDAFLEEEQMKFPDAFQILTKEMCGLGLESFWEPLKGKDGFPKAPPFSHQAFSQFRNMLKPETGNSHFSMTFFENEVLVDVEGLMVVQSLAPVLKNLLEKRGDISTKSRLSSNSKNLIFTMLCGAIRSMSSTKVDHPFFETLFYNWWNHVTMAKHAGFETRFFLGHLDKILRARFAVQADKVQEEKLKELAGQIKRCQASSEEWTVKAAELTDARRRYRESAESSLIKVLSIEAENLEGNTVGSALL
ncbi:hypothetical protein ACJRO7_019462 [Eucalyptus globulus]|uniref:Phorbol-ester/DAG-type domain-containing protein n=1 Tax=Eucalyptus globulus TaxID=34317 RepID=A0ABD3KQ72_EUCGL